MLLLKLVLDNSLKYLLFATINTDSKKLMCTNCKHNNVINHIYFILILVSGNLTNNLLIFMNILILLLNCLCKLEKIHCNKV